MFCAETSGSCLMSCVAAGVRRPQSHGAANRSDVPLSAEHACTAQLPPSPLKRLCRCRTQCQPPPRCCAAPAAMTKSRPCRSG